MITLYSKSNCSFCDRAKALLESKDIPFKTVTMEENPDAREYLMDQGLRSVPQLFNNGVLMAGGYQGLAGQTEEFFNSLKG